ncbi:MAG: VIT1/CCC1 transporter family protein [Rhabdochlamydiaceae bacterium]
MKKRSKDHLGGKSVIEHLKEARIRGALASTEMHGTEMAGHLAAGADAARETAYLLGILYLLVGHSFWILFIAACGFLIWKIGRSALLGWARLERLHRLIEEERWEIEHDRAQEEEEISALYQVKGFSGQLLKDVISTLASDDNRLLRVMLEEEMGLTLEVYEHPLKQCLGAAVGVLFATLFCLLGFLGGLWSMGIAIGMICAFSAWMMAYLQKNRVMEAVIWNLALIGFGLSATYLLKGLIVL